MSQVAPQKTGPRASPTLPTGRPPETRTRISYAIYAAGLNVMELHAALLVGARGYRVDLDYHTSGAYSVFVHSESRSTAQGLWNGQEAAPLRFFTEGEWHGDPREALIDYVNGQPELRTLVPEVDTEREPVPETLRHGTVDALSAMATMIRYVAENGTCDMQVRIFDGRGISEIVAQTRGQEALSPTQRSSYSGTALRCDFEGHEVAGFPLRESAEQRQQPHRGTAWMARVTPGGPPIPVRLAFETRWVGDATMYLTDADPGSSAVEAKR
jgi:hypothetical protein